MRNRRAYRWRPLLWSRSTPPAVPCYTCAGLWCCLPQSCPVRRFGVAEAIRTALSAPSACRGRIQRDRMPFPCLLEVSCGCVGGRGVRSVGAFPPGHGSGVGRAVRSLPAIRLPAPAAADRPGLFAARGLHALLGGILTMVLLRFVPVAVNTGISFSETVVKPYTTSVTASTALLLMCALFLLTLATNREALPRLHSGGGN